MQFLYDTAAWAYDRFIFLPFFTLYLHGPRLAGYGFWGGRSPAEICSTITTLPQQIFLLDPELCNGIMRRETESIVLSCMVVLYFYYATHVMSALHGLIHKQVVRFASPTRQLEGKPKVTL